MAVPRTKKKPADPEKNTCAICHEPCNVIKSAPDKRGPDYKEMFFTTPCGHGFGTKCLWKWLHEQQNSTCPLCRAHLPEAVMHARPAESGHNNLSIALTVTDQGMVEHCILKPQLYYIMYDHRKLSLPRGTEWHHFRYLEHSSVYFAVVTIPVNQQHKVRSPTVKLGLSLRERNFKVTTEGPAFDIFVNLNDFTEAWEIERDAHAAGVIVVDKRIIRIPQGATIALLRPNGRFVRFCTSFTAWLTGF